MHPSPSQRKEGSKKKKKGILDVFGNAMHAVCGQAQPSQRVLRAIELAGLHRPSGVFVVCCVWLGARLPRPASVQSHYSPTVSAQLRTYSEFGTTTCEDNRHHGMNIGAGVGVGGVGEEGMLDISWSFSGWINGRVRCLETATRHAPSDKRGVIRTHHVHHPTPSRTLSIRHIRV